MSSLCLYNKSFSLKIKGFPVLFRCSDGLVLVCISVRACVLEIGSKVAQAGL